LLLPENIREEEKKELIPRTFQNQIEKVSRKLEIQQPHINTCDYCGKIHRDIQTGIHICVVL
jgi:hypothetical protein